MKVPLHSNHLYVFNASLYFSFHRFYRPNDYIIVNPWLLKCFLFSSVSVTCLLFPAKTLPDEFLKSHFTDDFWVATTKASHTNVYNLFVCLFGMSGKSSGDAGQQQQRRPRYCSAPSWWKTLSSLRTRTSGLILTFQSHIATTTSISYEFVFPPVWETLNSFYTLALL